MSVIELRVYDILKTRFNEQDAAVFLEYFEERTEAKFEQKKDVLATKEDIAALRVEITQSKAELIKWMFIFLIGQAAAIISIIKLL